MDVYGFSGNEVKPVGVERQYLEICVSVRMVSEYANVRARWNGKAYSARNRYESTGLYVPISCVGATWRWNLHTEHGRSDI